MGPIYCDSDHQREEQESLLDLYMQAIKGAARAAKAA
jgi:uncharacterized protein (UPF0335 family)